MVRLSDAPACCLLGLDGFAVVPGELMPGASPGILALPQAGIVLSTQVWTSFRELVGLLLDVAAALRRFLLPPLLLALLVATGTVLTFGHCTPYGVGDGY